MCCECSCAITATRRRAGAKHDYTHWRTKTRTTPHTHTYDRRAKSVTSRELHTHTRAAQTQPSRYLHHIMRSSARTHAHFSCVGAAIVHAMYIIKVAYKSCYVRAFTIMAAKGVKHIRNATHTTQMCKLLKYCHDVYYRHCRI